MYCFIPDLPLNFTMCLSTLCSLSFHSTLENFEHSWSITGLILKALSLLTSFCYLQNVDFEGSHKNGFKSLCSEYRHYRSDYLLSNIKQSWVTYWLLWKSSLQEMLSVLPWQLWSSFHSDEHKGLIVQLSFLNISIGETLSFKLGCISCTRWHSSCLVTFTFFIHFHNSFFLSFCLWLIITSYYLKISIWCSQGSFQYKVSSSRLYKFLFSYEQCQNHSLNCLCPTRQPSLHHLIKHIFAHY